MPTLTMPSPEATKPTRSRRAPVAPLPEPTPERQEEVLLATAVKMGVTNLYSERRGAPERRSVEIITQDFRPGRVFISADLWNTINTDQLYRAREKKFEFYGPRSSDEANRVVIRDDKEKIMHGFHVDGEQANEGSHVVFDVLARGGVRAVSQPATLHVSIRDEMEKQLKNIDGLRARPGDRFGPFVIDKIDSVNGTTRVWVNPRPGAR